MSSATYFGSNDPKRFERYVDDPSKGERLPFSLDDITSIDVVAGRNYTNNSEGGFGRFGEVLLKSAKSEISLGIKVFHSTSREPAQEEYELLRQLNGAYGHAPKAYMFGEYTDSSGLSTPAIIMTRIKGHSLKHERDAGTLSGSKGANPSPIQTVAIAKELANAIGACHDKSIVHADLQPTNVMFADSTRLDCIALIDFGQSKYAESSVTPSNRPRLATISYGAPEIFPHDEQQLLISSSGEALPETPVYIPNTYDLRTRRTVDIWSFGALLYWLRSGAEPHRALLAKLFSDEESGIGSKGGITKEIAQAIYEIKRVNPLDLEEAVKSNNGGRLAPGDVELSKLILKCTNCLPANRPQTMEDVADLLEAAEAACLIGELPESPQLQQSDVDQVMTAIQKANSLSPSAQEMLSPESFSRLEVAAAWLRRSAFSLEHAAIAEISPQRYTGKEVCPSVSVTLLGRKLKNGRDYSVSYLDNINPGTATASITAKGDYTGTLSANFEILKDSHRSSSDMSRSLDGENSSYANSKTGKLPKRKSLLWIVLAAAIALALLGAAQYNYELHKPIYSQGENQVSDSYTSDYENLPAGMISGWGDNGGGRASYSIEDIESGALGTTIVFNSISDENVGIGNEKNFVGARLEPYPSGQEVVWNANLIEVEPGNQYRIRLYGHNNNPLGEDATAENVEIIFLIPEKSGRTISVYGGLRSENASPSEYSDCVVFTCKEGFHLEYVEGSAILHNNGIGANEGKSLSDSVIGRWTKVGYSDLDGRIPGCYEYTFVASVVVAVVAD